MWVFCRPTKGHTAAVGRKKAAVLLAPSAGAVPGSALWGLRGGRIAGRCPDHLVPFFSCFGAQEREGRHFWSSPSKFGVCEPFLVLEPRKSARSFPWPGSGHSVNSPVRSLRCGERHFGSIGYGVV